LSRSFESALFLLSIQALKGDPTQSKFLSSFRNIKKSPFFYELNSKGCPNPIIVFEFV
jgi:hypothetical protein